MDEKNSVHLSFTSSRRFGIELEINSFDGLNRPPKGKRPDGIEHVAQLVTVSVPDKGCEIKGYEHTANNDRWVVKPDASCGMEIVSPPQKGWKGLKECISVVEALANDPKVKVDHRCSMHVHVDATDLNESDVASIVAWWIKCEAVFLDAMPLDRKRNRYCQAMGFNSMFQHNGAYSDRELIVRAGDLKYYSMNTHNWVKGSRKTIEFRPIEGAGCKDPYLIKNWVRLLIHFCETAIKVGRPENWREPNNQEEAKTITPWTGLCWLDPEQVISFLGFNNKPVLLPHQKCELEFTLSNGLQQTRNWFMSRLLKHMSRHKPGGMRYYAFLELQKMLERFKESGIEIHPEEHLSPAEFKAEELYGDDFKY
jgi:hypothetical protein